MTKPRNIKDALFQAKRTKLMDKEFNYLVFQMENKLSDAEMEYIQLWFKQNKGKAYPNTLKFPNNETKTLVWTSIK